MPILEDLQKNSLRSCYLLYGEEKYLLNEAVEKLRLHFGGEENSLAVQIFSGSEYSLQEILQEANTVSFFASEKLLLVRNAPWFSPAKKAEDDKAVSLSARAKTALAAYLSAPPPDCCIVFLPDTAPDKRLALYKLIAEAGGAEEFALLNRQAQAYWLGDRFAAAGKRAKLELINKLCAICGGSLYTMASEADKVLLRCADMQVLTLEACEDILSPSVELSVFELVDAVSQRQGAKAVALYEEMLARGEAAQKIAVLLIRQFHNMLAIYDMKRQGLTQRDMKRELGIDYDFLLEKLSRYASCFTAGELMRCIDSILRADYVMKSGGRDMTSALKELILKISL